jgi:hypothetical protein
MVSMIVNPQQQSTLKGASGPVHLVDESGTVVRVALTPEEYDLIMSRRVKAPPSDQELARYADEPGTGSLQEFWKQIGAK